jgi:hypothetical protein
MVHFPLHRNDTAGCLCPPSVDPTESLRSRLDAIAASATDRAARARARIAATEEPAAEAPPDELIPYGDPRGQTQHRPTHPEYEPSARLREIRERARVAAAHYGRSSDTPDGRRAAELRAAFPRTIASQDAAESATGRGRETRALARIAAAPETAAEALSRHRRTRDALASQDAARLAQIAPRHHVQSEIDMAADAEAAESAAGSSDAYSYVPSDDTPSSHWSSVGSYGGWLTESEPEEPDEPPPPLPSESRADPNVAERDAGPYYEPVDGGGKKRKSKYRSSAKSLKKKSLKKKSLKKKSLKKKRKSYKKSAKSYKKKKNSKSRKIKRSKRRT